MNKSIIIKCIFSIIIVISASSNVISGSQKKYTCTVNKYCVQKQGCENNNIIIEINENNNNATVSINENIFSAIVLYSKDKEIKSIIQSEILSSAFTITIHNRKKFIYTDTFLIGELQLLYGSGECEDK